MRPSGSATNERRTYWPRYGPAVPPPDFHDDRSCTNCGYNLRGLSYSDACPECGSVRGMSPSEEPLPFDERQTLGTYLATIFQILIEPSNFGSHLWREGRLDWRAARRFRRLNMAIGAVCFGIVLLVLTADATSPHVALAAWPFSMMAVLLWLNRVTLDRLRFLESEALLPRDPQRTKALASYLSAPLALSPVQLIALYASRPAAASGVWLAAAGIHLFLLLVQFLLTSQAEAHFLWQLVDMPKAQARGMGVAAAIVRILEAAPYLAGVPLLFVLIAKHLVRG